jgi:hypothetical protein
MINFLISFSISKLINIILIFLIAINHFNKNHHLYHLGEVVVNKKRVKVKKNKNSRNKKVVKRVMSNQIHHLKQKKKKI